MIATDTVIAVFEDHQAAEAAVKRLNTAGIDMKNLSVVDSPATIQGEMAMPDHRRLLLDNPWMVNPTDFPAGGTPNEQLLFLLNYAVLAPSILNTQPWRFRIDGDEVEISADRRRILPVTDPQGRELLISCGAALLNLRVAMRGFGCGCEVKILSDVKAPDFIAKVRLTGVKTSSNQDKRLRDAICVRGTNRREFADRPLDPGLLTKLAAAARRERATLIFIDGTDAKREVTDLVNEAEQMLLSDPGYRHELANWIGRRAGETLSPAREGFVGMAGHLPTLPDQAHLRMVNAVSTARRFSSGEEAIARQTTHIAAAPVLALLTTDDDTPESWIAAGQALQSALLFATSVGVSASFLNPPTEVPILRLKLARIFGTTAMAQVLLRFGYGPEIGHEGRQPISDVID